MRIAVVAVGKIRERELRTVANDYLARLQHYARCDEIEVRDNAALERALPRDSLLIALDAGGESMTSSVFAERLSKWFAQGKGIVAFVIGAADGIPDSVLARATVRLSLSSMTLPHRLARVVLFEQLYRAMTLIRGEPYPR